jgi:hypothetical protein
MRKYFAVLMALSLGACASAPNVTYGYFLPTSRTTVSLTQTIDCTQDKTAFIVTYGAPQVTTVNFADYSRGPYTLDVKKLDSALADTSFSFNLSDDGRLKSINAFWTGQGETVLQSAISLGTSLVALSSAPPGPPQVMPECTFLKNWGGGKPLSIVYSGLINLADNDSNDLRLEPAKDQTSTKIYEGLDAEGKLPDVELSVLSRAEIPSAANYAGAAGDYSVWLTLNRTENVKFNINTSGKTIYSSAVIVPGTGTYQIPVPGAAIFGTQSFALSLTDAGGISSISYGKLTGAASPLNVANSLATAVTPH